MERNSNKNQSILNIVLNRDFVMSAIIPIAIFTIFDKLNMTLNGIILSGIWSVALVLFNFIKDHKVNALALMAGIFSVISLIGTIISKNPDFYFIAPIVRDILYAVVFFGSLFFERSLIQVIVEQTYLKNVSEETKKKANYKSAWMIISFTWGVLNVIQALLRVILLHAVSASSYYTISTLFDNISTPLLVVFSIAFPKWYWTKKQLN